ncbi:MAG: hypothetical protein KJO50_07190, partial [Bacteroidia bacterium]|nr:hypothetical protein [Bacteroidia bacterium]
MKLTHKLTICLSLICSILTAQGFNEYLNAYSNDNRIGYLQPLADLSISGLNATVPMSSYIGKDFYLNLNFAGVYSKPVDSQRTFTGWTDPSFSEQISREVPTIIGANESVMVTAADGTSYVFATGYNIDFLPLVIPQLTIGGIAGTELTGRFFAWDTKDDFGKFDLLGIGLRHSIDQHISRTFPVAINIGYQFNKSDIGRYMKLQSHFGYIQGAYQTGLLDLSLYGGYQTGDFDVYYSFNSIGEEVDIETNLKNADKILAGMGARVQLGFFAISASLSGPKPLMGNVNLEFRIVGKKKTDEVIP